MTRESVAPTASVLVVEHSPAIRRLFEVVLRDVADPLFIVGDQSEARELLTAEPIDAVLLEPHGPHQIDWGLLDHLTAIAIPVIVVTSRADEEVQEEATRRGATAFLTKPFMPEELQMIVRNIIAANNV
jgi:two-component system KDP operon response regulator KdpE